MVVQCLSLTLAPQAKEIGFIIAMMMRAATDEVASIGNVVLDE